MAANLWDVSTDGKLNLSFHKGQAEAWQSDRRFVFVIAGTQSGKTSWGPWWLWREIQRTASPEGGNDYIAATASYDLFKLKMLPELRTVFERVFGMARYWSGDRIMELRDPSTGKFWASKADDPMWGRIILRSAEAGGGLESASAKAAWLDECGQDSFTVETWEAVRRRLALHRGRALGTTTPYNLGWLKTQIYDKWHNGDQSIAVVNFPSFVNPVFSREEYEEAKATMPPWRFAMFYKGELTKPAGLIYDCFDDDIHIVDDFAIPSDWPRYVGLDFGAVNTALVWLAHDQSKDVYYEYRESLEGSKTTAEHVRAAQKAAESENIVTWAGGSYSEDQPRRDWKQSGIDVRRPSFPEVESGITRVYGFLKPYRLKVFRSCVGTIDEFGSYKRKLDPNGDPTPEIVDKRKFHRLDALRYICTMLGVKKSRFGAV